MKLLILSDIHANWPALRAVLEAEPDVDGILCLGDLVDYGPEPLRCVEWAIDRVAPKRLIQGNHDWAVGWNEDPKCSPPYRHLADVTRKHCLRGLTESLRHFLCELAPQRSFAVDGESCFACHAAPSDPLFRYLHLNGEVEQWKDEIARAGQPAFLFLGHTHLPGTMRLGGTEIVNPGSVGQPKDGDPRAAYALWQDGSVTLRRAAYDIEETVRAYGATPFSEEDITALAAILRTGGSSPDESNAAVTS